MEAAAQLLSVRARSVAEMRRRLSALGYPAGLVDEVIGRLEAMSYLDDHAFATSWVASRDRSRPRGGSALRQELRLKGIDDATIRAVLAERETGGPDPAGDPERDGAPGERADVAAAGQLLERKAAALRREPDVRKRRQKAYALLARNGFDPDTCRTAIAMPAWMAGDDLGDPETTGVE
ncbi:MAG: regulatory protein RecX [Chloroflexota bacterium]